MSAFCLIPQSYRGRIIHFVLYTALCFRFFFIMLIFPVFCNTFLSVFHYFKVYSATFHANSISQPHNLISSLRRKWNKKAEAISSAPLEMPLFRHRLLSLHILSHFRLRNKV